MISVGGVIGGAFRVIRDRPLAVLIWGLLYMAVAASGALLLSPQMMRGQLSGNPDAMGQLWAMLLPYYLLLLIVSLVLGAASLRAVLRPDERSFAALRIGMDELRLLGLWLILFVAFFVLAFILGIIVTIFAGIMMAGAAVGQGASGFAGIFVVMALLWLVFAAALVFFSVRFSLVGALTIARRKIIIGESWTLTRGNFWRLFAVYLVIAVIQLALYVLAAAATMGPYLGTLIEGGFSARAFQEASQAQMALQLAGISPALILSWVVQGLLGAVAYAMWGGAVGAATEGLIGPSVNDYAATFE